MASSEFPSRGAVSKTSSAAAAAGGNPATTKKLESALRYIEGGAGASQRREIPHMGLPHKALTASPRSSANLSQPSGGRFGAIRDELFGWMN